VTSPTLADARSLRLIRRFPIPSRNHARPKPKPCICPGPYAHAFCWVVTCKCDHGIGAR
jgi:hypothetical protein